MNVAERLKACPQLSDLPDSDFDALAAAVAIIKAEDGMVFVHEGDRGDGCYVVLEGKVGISHAHARGGGNFKELAPGDLFGLVALIDHGPRSATCRAIGPTSVAWLSAAAFELLHSGSPSVALRFRKMVARQLARDVRGFNGVLVAAMVEGQPDGGAVATEEFHLMT